MNKSIVMAALLLTLTACASDKPKPREINIEEYLAQQITDDNIKLFSYSMTFPVPKRREGMRGQGGMGGGGKGREGMEGGGMRRGGMGGGAMGGGGMPDPEVVKKRMEDRMLQRLAEKIKESGYCREGYKILDKDIARGYASIRGQCNDSANEADIKTYKIDKPVG